MIWRFPEEDVCDTPPIQSLGLLSSAINETGRRRGILLGAASFTEEEIAATWEAAVTIHRTPVVRSYVLRRQTISTAWVRSRLLMFGHHPGCSWRPCLLPLQIAKALRPAEGGDGQWRLWGLRNLRGSNRRRHLLRSSKRSTRATNTQVGSRPGCNR